MTDTVEESLVRGHGGHVLLVLSVGWLSIQAGRLVLSPLLPTIIDDLGITPTRAGVALTTLWGLYALAQYPSGRISDGLSRKTPLVGGLALAVVGFVLLAGAVTYPLFLVGAAVVGVGVGFYPTAARALVSDHFVGKRGGAYGVHTASGDVGGVLAAGLAVAVLATTGWRTAFLPVAVGLAAVLVALHFLGRERYEVEPISLEARPTVDRLFATGRMRWLVCAYCLFAFAWQGSVGFLPTMLQTSKGFSPALAGVGFAGLFVVGAVVKPVAGTVSDRVPRGPVAAFGLLVGAVALLALVVVEGRLGAAAATVLYAVGLMSFPPVMQSYLMDTFPDATAGADLGLARTVYIGVGALGPTYVGATAEWVGYRAAFLGIVACLVVGAAVVAWQTAAE